MILDILNKFLIDSNIHVFFISIDAERAFCENTNIVNFHRIASVPSSWSDKFNKSDLLLENIDYLNSHELLENDQVIEFIKSFNAKEVYIQTFKINKRFQILVQSLGYKLLNADSDLSKSLESKFNLEKIVGKLNVNIPQSKIINFDEMIEDNAKKVISINDSHSGLGTFIVDKNLSEYSDHLKGTKVKVSDYIEGINLNINALITKESIDTFGLNEQISAIDFLAPKNTITLGNNYNISKYPQSIINSCIDIVRKIANYAKSHNYIGFLGVDLIYNPTTQNVYLIEINARQTANVTNYTKFFGDNYNPEITFLAKYFNIICHEGNYNNSSSDLVLIVRNYTNKVMEYNNSSLEFENIKLYNTRKINPESELFRIFDKEDLLHDNESLKKLVNNVIKEKYL